MGYERPAEEYVDGGEQRYRTGAESMYKRIDIRTYLPGEVHSYSVVCGLVGRLTEIRGNPVVSGEGILRGTMSSLAV